MLDEMDWLKSESGLAAIRQAEEWFDAGISLTTRAKRLRKLHESGRARLIGEQVELRDRATKKFSLPRGMLFTRVGLEQSTSESIALYKSLRFPRGKLVHDLCCGIGGDALGLARRGPVSLWDRDATHLYLAEFNVGQAAEFPVSAQLGSIPNDWLDAMSATAGSGTDQCYWHLDPDRRTDGLRSVTPTNFSPNLTEMERLLELYPNGAIKLAPATELPESWYRRCELEFVGDRTEVKQQVAWFGTLANPVGGVRATIVRNDEERPATFCGDKRDESVCRVAPDIGEFLYQPHPTIRRSGLLVDLAERHDLQRLNEGHGWLVSHQAAFDPFLITFRLLDQSPLRDSDVAQMLHRNAVGRIETMVHGLENSERWIRRAWRLEGEQHATLLLTRFGQRQLAILLERISAR